MRLGSRTTPAGQPAAHPEGSRRRHLTLAAATVAAVVLVSGVAYAFWTATGTGTSTVGSTSAIPLGVSSITTPLVDLYPGKVDDLGFKVSNTNPYPVTLTKLTAASVTSSDTINCPASNITLNAPIMTAVGTGGYTLPTALVVPAGSSTTTGTLTGMVQLNAAALDGCQGKTFTVSLTFTGSQS